MVNRLIKFFLHHRLVTFLLILGTVITGIVVSPFQWKIGGLPSDPIAVDALPDIGENQQIIFTEWEGRSPQDIEDQITYPLTTLMLGLPGVKDIRSSSMQGFSMITVIFDKEVDFYWSRSRILEKLNSLPQDLIPTGVKPSLGPDATGLGQVFWYTIEGRDKEGNLTGGWDLHEIRSVQDFYVKYLLSSVEGVSEVASIGGDVREYQVDIDPESLKKYKISIEEIADAIRKSNRDVGAKTMEINQAEYLVRGLGLIKSIEDIESAVIKEVDNTPIRIEQVARVNTGPAPKKGALDKNGLETVGGVVISRYGENTMKVIQDLKDKIELVQDGLPSKTLEDGTESQLTIVPFYDRSTLIKETLNTLYDALTLQVLITILVIIVMVYNLRASFAISALLPLSILMIFMAMKAFKIDANIVSLSGIAIAIGTMVDLGIILSENVIKKIKAFPKLPLIDQIYQGSKEVSSAIITAVATTIISFIPVFTLQEVEGKLFIPLAFTKTFALMAALLVSLMILPTLLYWFFGIRVKTKRSRSIVMSLLLILAFVGVFKGITLSWILLIFVLLNGGKRFIKISFPKKWIQWIWNRIELGITLFIVLLFLSTYWMPLGEDRSQVINFLFVFLMAASILGFFLFIQYSFIPVLRWCLAHKKIFLSIPIFFVFMGVLIWLGFANVFGFVEKGLAKINYEVKQDALWVKLTKTFPGIGNEFMPSLDEGTFLLMPTTMPHSGVEYNQKVLSKVDILTAQIPEIESVVGKMGRAETALDPAPMSMFENIINYKNEFAEENGKLLRFKVNDQGLFVTHNGEALTNDEVLESKLPINLLERDPKGKVFRNWRSSIKTKDDIWNEIVNAIKIPGLTSAPKLQPIETRNLMLQTGMNAPMGVKIHGPDLKTIEAFGLELEKILKAVPGVKAEAVFAERVVGKPYLLLDINREKLGRYGFTVDDVQSTIEMAIGGEAVATTIEGRERYTVRVRYPRAYRNSPDDLENILVTNKKGLQVPLSDVVQIDYERGPQEIHSENTFLTSYVLFDKQDDYGETDVAHKVLETIEDRIAHHFLEVPDKVTYELAGNYQNQLRAEKRFILIIPAVLGVVFLILYFQFRSVKIALIVFSSITLAFSGGFLMLWLYGQDWFFNFDLFQTSMRELFQIHPINLSVAVWVGFIALFGLATDDGVLMATYLDQSFAKKQPETIKETREMVLKGAQKRIRPAVMTAATTVIALLPVLTSVGRGSDIMIPMAIPAYGGMIMTCITFYIVPTLYAVVKEHQLKQRKNEN